MRLKIIKLMSILMIFTSISILVYAQQEEEVFKSINFDIQQKEYEDALRRANRYLKLNPDSDKIRDLKIRILLYTDRISQAIDEYKKLDILEQSEKESILKHICLYVLYETVRTAEEDVPIEAAKVLGELQRKEVVPALIELLEKDDKESRHAAAIALGDIGDLSAVPVLISSLKDDSEEIRIAAARALKKLEDPSSIPALKESLKDSSYKVRIEAALALGKLSEDMTSTASLIKELRTGNEEVKISAAIALGKLGNPLASPALKETLSDKSPAVRVAAATALGQIGDVTAIPALANVIENESGENSPEVRIVAATALGKIKNVNAIDRLLKVINDENDNVRVAVIRAIGEFEGEVSNKVIDAVIEQTRAPEPNVRIAATRTLAKLGEKELLLKILEDKNKKVRQAAAIALGQLGCKDAVSALITALDDDDPEVRIAAVKALWKLLSEEKEKS